MKTLLPMLGRLVQFLNLNRLFARRRVVPCYAGIAPNSPNSEDGLNERYYLPGREEILVVEVNPMDFVREWSQSIASGSEAHAHEKGEEPPEEERRLPNHDRRRPNHDRRAENGHDRRGSSLSAGNSPDTPGNRAAADAPRAG